ncbi:hypothetical protein AvCA_14100 [Azotobacter vinelandii CA]|uniref:Uncharacterized protein n=2 Tax=Azotobacter vinelandii TaxID=354 RepID=C1DQV3_AZOVD|nr:hypothetical protein Avin_14100 [Azotobacter vinelandii DJ]AGK17008.1 hypothetical protein AvCA_14100 [Azotobacter vinelandii CA]AGK19892.1 hypothetical protein AvCA6_14100 [Azotobacter vinelandii CA6]
MKHSVLMNTAIYSYGKYPWLENTAE